MHALTLDLGSEGLVCICIGLFLIALRLVLLLGCMACFGVRSWLFFRVFGVSA